MMHVAGVDLSLTSTGLTSLHGAAVTTQRIRSKGAATATLPERRSRICRLIAQITEHIGDVDLVVIESPSYGSNHGSAHDRSGLWWLLVDALMAGGIPIATIAPTSVKKYATGKGNAQKDHVLAAVIRRYPHIEVTGNDVADSLVLAAMGRRHLGAPIEDSLPAINLAAMTGGAWPTLTT